MVALVVALDQAQQVALEIDQQYHHRKETMVVQELHQAHHGQEVVAVAQVQMVLLGNQDLHPAEMVALDYPLHCQVFL
jgi:hypothetical protein